MATQVKTKAAPKKAAAKKAAPKAAPKKAPSRLSTADVFSINPQANQPVEVPRGTVHLVINGESKGTVESGNITLGDFVTAHAQRAGMRSFSVMVDGQKVDTSATGKPLTGVTKVELVAKDARGKGDWFLA